MVTYYELTCDAQREDFRQQRRSGQSSWRNSEPFDGNAGLSQQRRALNASHRPQLVEQRDVRNFSEKHATWNGSGGSDGGSRSHPYRNATVHIL